MCCYLTIGNDNNNNMNSKLLQRKNVKKNRFVPEICVTFILYTSRNLNSYTHREAERERERESKKHFTNAYKACLNICQQLK